MRPPSPAAQQVPEVDHVLAMAVLARTPHLREVPVPRVSVFFFFVLVLVAMRVGGSILLLLTGVLSGFV